MDDRFGLFAQYEDAVLPGESMTYHSGLSMAINIGLIFPQEVLTMVLAQPYSHSQEAYVRQLIGWREYARLYSEYAYRSEICEVQKLLHPVKSIR